MNKFLRIVLLTTAAGVLLVLGTGVVVAATVVQAGFISVEVEEKAPDGVSFSASVPAKLVQYGAGLTRLINDEDLDRARQELQPFLPMVEDFTDELRKSPSFTLVEVQTDTEYVHIAKDGRTLRIHVDNDDARVSIAIPVELVERVLDSVAG